MAISDAGDLADPLVVHVAGDDLRAERDGGDDRRLRTGVEALDVGRRVALGVAELLGLGQRRGVVRLRHRRRPRRSSG